MDLAKLNILLEESNGFPSVRNWSSTSTKLRPIEGNCQYNSILGTSYWIEIEEDELEKQEWFFLMECLPKQNKLSLSRPKPFSILQKIINKKNWFGIPKFFGLSLFGNPTSDIRVFGKEASTLTLKNDRQLRNYQEIARTNALSSLEQWGGATIIADCGAGKTAMALSIACKLQRKTLVICNRVFLMEQWKEEIINWTNVESVGWLQSNTINTQSDINVASIDSLCQCEYSKEVLDEFGLVIIDEMHHLAALSLSSVLPKLKPRYILGISATPDRNDGLEHLLYWLAGPTCFVYKRLPEVTGLKNTVKVHQIVFKDGQQKVITYGDKLGFSAMVSHLALDEKRNELILKLCDQVKLRKKILVVTSLVNHAKLLFKNLENASLIYGGYGNKEQAKESQFVVATYQYLEEGYDDPSIDTLILALPRSKIQQTIGRCERTKEGKSVPEVFDIVDDFSIFKAMWYKRQKFYVSRGFQIYK